MSEYSDRGADDDGDDESFYSLGESIFDSDKDETVDESLYTEQRAFIEDSLKTSLKHVSVHLPDNENGDFWDLYPSAEKLRYKEHLEDLKMRESELSAVGYPIAPQQHIQQFRFGA